MNIKKTNLYFHTPFRNHNDDNYTDDLRREQQRFEDELNSMSAAAPPDALQDRAGSSSAGGGGSAAAPAADSATASALDNINIKEEDEEDFTIDELKSLLSNFAYLSDSEQVVIILILLFNYIKIILKFIPILIIYLSRIMYFHYLLTIKLFFQLNVIIVLFGSLF